MKRLKDLLPDFAIETDTLDYGERFDAPGLYYTLRENGELASVGIVEWHDPPSWAADRTQKVVMCRSFIRINQGNRSGYRRGVMFGTTYEEDGTLKTANGYNEDDDITQSKENFENWASRDIEQQIAYVKDHLLRG